MSALKHPAIRAKLEELGIQPMAMAPRHPSKPIELIVVNRAGASGGIGWTELVNAKPMATSWQSLLSRSR